MNETPVAVVTGGAGGLGSAIGRTLASDGFQVVLAGRSLEATQRVADEHRRKRKSRSHIPGRSTSRTVNRSPRSPAISVNDSGASTFW